MSETLNGDLTRFCKVDTAAMEWSASPSGTVWRKRVHLVGPVESGQVTSIVRYEANSEFAEHPHPGGEEILVLNGVFSDQQGDWPAGTYLLNPEGFRHAPYSRDGCVLFVKLRQYPGPDRRQLALDTNTVQWRETGMAGVLRKRLYEQAGYADSMELQRWESAPTENTYPEGAEMYVIEGNFEDEYGKHGAGSWLRFPAGAQHYPVSREGCTIYLKRGGFRYLSSVAN